jgi:NADH:ubiquinone oxidoreductase subunit F (NADH-binding)
MDDKKLYESVHNYTKYKLVEMLLKRLNDGRTKMDDLNSIEDLADEVLRTLAICGLKYHNELRENFEEE